MLAIGSNEKRKYFEENCFEGSIIVTT